MKEIPIVCPSCKTATNWPWNKFYAKGAAMGCFGFDCHVCLKMIHVDWSLNLEVSEGAKQEPEQRIPLN